MTLTKQPLPITFAGGVETRQDAKAVPPTKLLGLENATFIKQTSLAKRNGYRELSRLIDGAGMEYADAAGLADRGDELLLFTGQSCLSYRASVDRWSDTGEVASVVANHRPIARTGTAQTMADHATNLGVTVVAWEDSRGGVRCSIVETEGGRSLLADTLLDINGTRPRCVAVGTALHVYWVQASAGRICVAVINPALPAAAPVFNVLVEDLSTTNPSYDACPVIAAVLAAQPALLAWVTATGWRVGYVHPSGVIGSSVVGMPAAVEYNDGLVVSGIGCAVQSSAGAVAKLAVVYCAAVGTTLLTQIDNDDLASSSMDPVANGAVATRITCGWNDSGTVWWASEHAGATADLNYVRRGSITGATISAVATLRGHGLASRAFTDDGHVYAALAHAPHYFTYTAVVRLSAATFGDGRAMVAASMLPVETPGLPTRVHLASVQPVDPDAAQASRQHALTMSYRIQLTDDDGDGIDEFTEEGIRLAALHFDHDDSYQTATLGRGLYLASACLQHYDGARWAESGFLCAPDVVGALTGTPSATGGSIDGGTYLYALCYEHIDANGEQHLGAVSPGITVVVPPGTTGSVVINLPTCRLTNRANARIGVYRSPMNQTGDSIPLYRVSGINPLVTTGANAFVPNNASVDTIAFTDALSNAAGILRDPLYTNGGIASNDPAPMAGNVLIGGKGRLFWTDQADPQLVRFSKPRLDDTALEAPGAFSLPCDPFGGDITALGVVDDAVIVGKETALHMFTGPGPLANPDADTAVAGFSPTVLLTSDVGIQSPGSVGQMPNGIMFKSTKGVMLLDRSRQVQRIGTPVDGYNEQRIMRTTLLPDRTQVLMLTDSGVSLLFDYERAQWSTFTNHEGYDARVAGGVYYYLRTDGRVFAETPALYQDGTSHIRIGIKTAWIKAAGYLQGWSRIFHAFFLGEWKSAHTLRVRYRLDYEDAWSEPFLLAVDDNYDPDNFGEGAYGAGPYGGDATTSIVYQRSLHLNQRCQAIQFWIEDVEPTDSYGASFELSEMLLTGGILGPAFRPGEARSD